MMEIGILAQLDHHLALSFCDAVMGLLCNCAQRVLHSSSQDLANSS